MKLFILFVLVASLSNVFGQNCGVSDTDETTITMDPVLETTGEDVVIWDHPTYNVTSAASVSSPHTKYLNGLRYAARYVYTASALFKDFVITEHSNQIQRDVIFTCSDGRQKAYTFLVPIIDENNQKPVFEYKNYETTVSLSNPSSEPHNANVVVSDGDYEMENAQIIIRSSNVMITPFVDPQWSGEHPKPYAYRIDFFYNRNLEVGSYNVILTADDGKNSDYTMITVVVTP